VLNAIYETDFLGFSYGFRPGRSQHQALDALVVGIYRRRVNWILDADIRPFPRVRLRLPEDKLRQHEPRVADAVPAGSASSSWSVDCPITRSGCSRSE